MSVKLDGLRCGQVWEWMSNSIITHAVSKTPLGPYTLKDCAMKTCLPEAHEGRKRLHCTIVLGQRLDRGSIGWSEERDGLRCRIGCGRSDG